MSDRPTTIIRAKRSETPYFMMSRATAQDTNLSWAARGVLTYLLSKPDDWRVNVKDLQQNCGRDKVYNIVDELIKHRYMARSKGQSVDYIVYEVPLPENTEVEVGLPEKPYTEIPDQENTDTYIVENKEQITESTEKTIAPASPALVTEMPQVSSPVKQPILKAVPKKPSKVPKKVPLPQHAELKVLIHRYGFDDADSRVTWARSSDVATALLDDDPAVTPADFQNFADDWIAKPGNPSFPCGTDTLPSNYAKWKAGRNGHDSQSNAENAAQRQRGNAAELERIVAWDDDGTADSHGAADGLPTGNRSAA